MFYIVKIELTLARFAAWGMELSSQEEKQTLTHFRGCGRASDLQQQQLKGCSWAQPPAAAPKKPLCRAVSKEQWMPQAASSPEQPEVSWVGTDRLDPLPFPQPLTPEARQEIFGRCKQALHPTPSQAQKGCFPLHKTANSHLIFHPTRLPGNKKLTRKQV